MEISNFKISNNRVFVIAEIGNNHEGSYKNAIAYKGGLIGKNISSFFQITDLIEKELSKDPGSRAAFNIALHDAFCKSSNISLSK